MCKGRGIQLDYIADGAKLDFLKPGEVYSLFGNALDNAIEAVTPLEPDRRYIGLQVRAERGMLLIRMENCAAEPLHFVDGLPQTTKGDARWHGFGVKSIRPHRAAARRHPDDAGTGRHVPSGGAPAAQMTVQGPKMTVWEKFVVNFHKTSILSAEL